MGSEEKTLRGAFGSSFRRVMEAEAVVLYDLCRSRGAVRDQEGGTERLFRAFTEVSPGMLLDGSSSPP